VNPEKILPKFDTGIKCPTLCLGYHIQKGKIKDSRPPDHRSHLRVNMAIAFADESNGGFFSGSRRTPSFTFSV